MTKRDIAAFLLGVLFVCVAYRWYSMERDLYRHEMHINYIEGFLEKATR